MELKLGKSNSSDTPEKWYRLTTRGNPHSVKKLKNLTSQPSMFFWRSRSLLNGALKEIDFLFWSLSLNIMQKPKINLAALSRQHQ